MYKISSLTRSWCSEAKTTCSRWGRGRCTEAECHCRRPSPFAGDKEEKRSLPSLPHALPNVSRSDVIVHRTNLERGEVRCVQIESAVIYIGAFCCEAF